jgi:hypothetical protein
VSSDCSICGRKDVVRVNHARFGERASLNAIAKRFGLAKATTVRHFGHTKAPAESPAPELGDGPDAAKLALVAPPSPPRGVRSCIVCPSPHRLAIEQALAANTSCHALGTRYGMSPEAIERHAGQCIPEFLERTRVLVSAQTVAERIKALLDQADEFLRTAKEEGDLKAWGVAVGRIEGATRLYGQFTGELGGDPDAAILASAKWREIKTIIADALRPYPDAMEAVARAFERLRS